jgi:O-antigen/teichoic acid export membrane protein
MRTGASIIRGTLGFSALNNLTILANFLIQIMLARHLSPSVFGTVALAFAILSVFQFFVHWGTNAALMQEGRDPALADTLFYLRAACGLLTGLLVIVAYYLLAPYYSLEIRQCMVILSLCTISAFLYDVFKAVMQKEMMLVKLGWLEFVSVAIGGAIALPMVLMGFEIWGLVSFHIVTTVIRGLGYILFSPYRPRLRFSKSEAVWAWSFGRKIIMVGALDNVDFRLGEWYLGTVRGESELGIYGLAWRLSHLFQRVFLPVLELTSLPTYANLKNDPELLHQAYDFVVRVLIRILTPACILAGIFAPELIVFLVGEQWSASVPVFRVLLIFAIASPLFRMHQQLLYALGRPEDYLKLKFYQVLIFITTAIPLTTYWGGIGLAFSMGLGFAVGVLLVLNKIRKRMTVPIGTILNTLLAGLVAYLPSVWITQRYVTVSSPILIGTTAIVFLTVYFAWLLVFEPQTLKGDIRRVSQAVFRSESKNLAADP